MADFDAAPPRASPLPLRERDRVRGRTTLGRSARQRRSRPPLARFGGKALIRPFGPPSPGGRRALAAEMQGVSQDVAVRPLSRRERDRVRGFALLPLRVVRGSASAGCPRGDRGGGWVNRATSAAVDPRTPWTGPGGWDPRQGHLAARSVSPDRRGHRLRIPRPDGRPGPRGSPAPLARMGAACRRCGTEQ